MTNEKQTLSGRRRLDGSYTVMFNGSEYSVTKIKSKWFVDSDVLEETSGPYNSYSGAKEEIPDLLEAEKGSVEVGVSIWDCCHPAALLAQLITREGRKPSDEELHTIDCCGYAGIDGKEIDWEAVNSELNRWEEAKKYRKV